VQASEQGYWDLDLKIWSPEGQQPRYWDVDSLSVTSLKGILMLISPMNQMLRNFEYRLYPKKKQLVRLHSTFRLCSEVFNLMLAEHEAAYEWHQ
jgi:hypothetical protein